MRFLIAASAAALILATPAFAQDVVVAEPTVLQQIINAAAPAVLAGLGAILLLIVNSLAGYVKDKFGIDIEARHREALHSALLTGIRMALVRLGWVPGTDVPQQAVTMAIDYARQSVPDAIKELKADGPSLARIAESKAPIATAEIAASGPEPVKVAPAGSR